MKTVTKVTQEIKGKLDRAEPMSNSETLPQEPTQPQDSNKWASSWRILYGMKLISFEVTDSDYEIWRRGVADLSDAELDNGVNKARDYEGKWFALNDFRKLCKFTTQDLGLPTVEEAYREACLAGSPKERQKWSHPIVYMAGCSVGWFNLRKESESKMLPKYKHYYSVLVERVRNGEQFKVQAGIEKKQRDAFSRTPKQHKQDLAEFQRIRKQLRSETAGQNNG